jgi:serine/threonine-protein kinase SRPK3
MNEETAEQDLEKFEMDELMTPSARKIDGDRVIHTSRPLVPPFYSYGRPVLCDFGEARLGEYDNMIDIQPYQYRAPEVILNIPWDEKVDIWSVGVMVHTAAVEVTLKADKNIVDLGPAWERKPVSYHWRARQ